MTEISLEHFKRAISDISANGDNDTLPFDIDNRFISENQEALANIAFELVKDWKKEARRAREISSMNCQLSWSRLSEQNLRVDKWSLCRG